MNRRTANRWLVVFLASMLALNASVAWYLRKQVASGYGDFAIFYTAGKILADGQGPRLYDLRLQFEKQQEFARDVETRQKGALPYNHPPFEAVLFWPLAKLPYFPAYCVWTVANLGLLFGIAYRLRGEVPWLQQAGVGIWVLAALAFFPVAVTLMQGQDTLWLLFCFVLAYGALRRDGEFAAGCWIGLGVFRPQFVVPLMVMVALQRRWKVLGGFAMVGGVLGLISAAIVGWAGILHYPQFALSVDRSATGVTAPWGMPNLHGLIDTIGSTLGASEGWVVAVTVVISAGLIAVANRVQWRGVGPEFDLGFSLAVVIAVLVSYHAFEHDLTLLLLPIALVVNFVGARRLGRVRRAALIAPVLVLFFTPLYVWLSFQMRQTHLLALVLLAWAWALWLEWGRVQGAGRGTRQVVGSLSRRH
jgi:alpha-1,2-mannosyltransferase